MKVRKTQEKIGLGRLSMQREDM